MNTLRNTEPLAWINSKAHPIAFTGDHSQVPDYNLDAPDFILAGSCIKFEGGYVAFSAQRIVCREQ